MWQERKNQFLFHLNPQMNLSLDAVSESKSMLQQAHSQKAHIEWASACEMRL